MKTIGNIHSVLKCALEVVIRMAKFQVLRSNQRLISLACGIDIKPKSNWTKCNEKFFTSIRVYLILFILTAGLLSCVVKTFDSSYNFTARLTAISFAIAMVQANAVLLNFGTKMPRFAALNQTIQTIVDGEGECALL